MRLRKLVIAPGGVVPWHEHSERPANIYVLSGEIVEYRANCLVPIVHKTGEVASEFGVGFAHWWKNTSAAPVELLSADIVTMEKKEDSMM
jgi:quercetin dioxygenase-like cupin family protein